jgi:hypothetical protein
MKTDIILILNLPRGAGGGTGNLSSPCFPCELKNIALGYHVVNIPENIQDITSGHYSCTAVDQYGKLWEWG